MAVRAKFKVFEIAKTEPWKTRADGTFEFVPTTVRLAPVFGEQGEDNLFGSATPNGEIRLVINNDEAAKQFKIGGAYYIDFVEAE